MPDPKRIDLGRGGFHPTVIAKAYREENPGMFDDLDDSALIDAIRDVDPDTYKLIDPLLIGAEALPMRATPPPAPPRIKPPSPGVSPVVPTALRIVPAVAGGIGGTLATGGPWGGVGGGMLGAGGGETAAQWYEKTFGPREEYDPGVIAFESILGGFNPATKGATTLGRIGWQGAYGAGLGAVGGTGRTLIEEGRLPTGGELLTNIALGGAFGAGTHGAFEGARNLTGRASMPVEGMGGFGDVSGPPPMSPADRLVMAQASAMQHEAEEAALAGRLMSLYGPDALRKPGQPDYHTAVQAKSYLDELANLNERPTAVPPYDPFAGAPASSLATGMIEPQAGPFARASQGLLESGRGDQGPFTVYPDESLVEPLVAGRDVAPPPTRDQLAGTPPPGYPVIGGTLRGDVAGPPTFEHALQQSLQQPPGEPRLVRPLTLTPPPAEPGVSRGTPSLLGSAPPSFESATQQTGRMGGRRATKAQPRLPGTETGVPEAGRPYATGPNAGPRRTRELHGAPRKWRRQVRTGDKVSYEHVPTPLHAEDPGTYPPEVRRELARIAYELDNYRWERQQGGLTSEQIEDYASTYNTDVMTAVAELKASGASSGGSIAGAPVYHEILKAAAGNPSAWEAGTGPRGHATRAEMLADIRAALLEGKGSVLSDAAAQIARGRIAQEAQGIERGAHSIIAPKGFGDEIIGWVDEAGDRALPEQELDEWQRAARDADDSEILTALKVEDESVGVEPERYFEVAPFFEAMRKEAVRRGLIEPTQPGLKLLGPGAEGGPPIRPDELRQWRQITDKLREELGREPDDLEVATAMEAIDTWTKRIAQRVAKGQELTPAEKAQAMDELGIDESALDRVAEALSMKLGTMRERQPTLPGTEGVRTQNIPTPKVSEVPFALTPPPGRPAKKQPPAQPSLLDAGGPPEPPARKPSGWGDLENPPMEELLAVEEHRRDVQAKYEAYREVHGLPKDAPLTDAQKMEAYGIFAERVPKAFVEGEPPPAPRKSESNWLKAAREQQERGGPSPERRRAIDKWLEEYHQREGDKLPETESGLAVERERQRIEAQYRQEHNLPLRRAADREILSQPLSPDEEWRLVFGTEPPPAPGSPPPKKPEGPIQPSIWRRLMDEKGVLILDVPAGDRLGLKRWLRAQEKEHGGEAWFSRVEEAIEEGDWTRAWKAAAAASATSYTKALKTASPRDEAVLRQIVHGTPLQDDLSAQIIAGARQRAGVGEAPKVKDFPPSKTVTQAGAARGKATIGPAGILNPGPRQRPLSSYDKAGKLAGGAAPELRGATLDRNVVRLIMEGIESPEGISTIPGNQDTYLRLFRQVGEQIYKGQNLKLLRDAGVRIPPEELAQHWNATISDAGRTLQMLSTFAQANAEILNEAAERMSMGGALHGMIPGSPPPRYVGARSRVLSPEGQKAAQAAVEEVAERTNRYQATALANDMQKRTAVGPLRALHDASYAWMLSKWNTGVRNYMSFTGRYGMDSLDHALTIPIAKLTGDEPTAALSSALLKERGALPFQRGAAVTPKAAWSDELQTIYDFTTDNLNRLKPKDVRHAIRLLLDAPEHMAEYLGTMGGEDLSTAFANVPVLRTLTNPKLQRFLTMFNRAQEFSARGVVFDATVRAQLRAKGLDPSLVLSKPTPEIIQTVGGQQAFDDLLFTATSQALEASFAGRTSKDSIPGALIRFLNEAWPSKLGIPFPRFNLSAAPRWIYDHSPAAILDWMRFPLDTLGITAPKGTVAGGRLYRGVRAQQIQRTDLPILQGKIGVAEKAQGLALQELLGTQREWNVRQRQVSRLQARAQQNLPEVATALQQATEMRDQLARRRERLKADVKIQRDVVMDLKSQQKKLLERVSDATAINAPNYAQSLARMSVGVGMLGAAMVVRSQEGAEGTRWYEYRVDSSMVPGRDPKKDPLILDFRPFAPFAQYLFVADVLNDFLRQTDWTAVHGEVAGTDNANPLAWATSIWDHYEGKYTEQELGSQFAQAFLSISRAAGTTLTLTDLATQEGLPSIGEFSRAIVGTIGQFFSRFTVPGQQISDVWGQFSEEEAKIRTPPRQTADELARPLAGPLANVPYARRLIPERISQTTGRPVATEYPLLRALAGIGTTPRDFVVEEVRRVGVPGQSVFIRETGDYGLDRAIAESYAKVLKEELPSILESEDYRTMGTPARQRDFLQRTIFPVLKRVALAEARSMVGEERYTEATVRGEEERRRARTNRLLDELEQEVPMEDDPLRGAPPPGPPGGGGQGAVPPQ